MSHSVVPEYKKRSVPGFDQGLTEQQPIINDDEVWKIVLKNAPFIFQK
jgi:hypothetical protein